MKRMLPLLLLLLPGIAPAQGIDVPTWLPLPASFEELTVGGIARWQWLALAVLFALSVVVGHLARVLIASAFRLRYRLWEATITAAANKGVKRGLVWLAAAGVWWLVLPELSLPLHFEEDVYTVLQIATVGGFIWLAYSLWDAACDALAKRASGFDERAERLLVPVTRKFVRVLIIIAGFLVVLGVVGVNVSGILAGVGIGGLVVALAAKDSVENIFGSFTILFDMPFSLGDFVKIGPVEGTVEEINLRSTRIRTGEDSIITLPNSNLIRASVENLGVRRYRRLKFSFGVAYDTPSARLEGFLQKVRDSLERHEKVRSTGYYAELNEFTDVSLRVLVECGLETASYGEELRIKGELLLDINEEARRMKVQLQGAPKPEEPSTASIAPPPQVGEKPPLLE